MMEQREAYSVIKEMLIVFVTGGTIGLSFLVAIEVLVELLKK